MADILTLDERDGITTVTLLERKLYQRAVTVFQETMMSLLEKEEEGRKFLIDLSGVEIMNSSGLGVLILTREALNRVGGELVVVGLRPFMKELFQRMRLDLLFRVEEGVEEGRKRLGGSQD